MNPKVALLGNMNNNFFNLCRFLRERGVDAVLYVFPFDPPHFQPEADTFDNPYKDYVKWLEWGNPYELYRGSAETIRAEFGGYDFLIGCGTAPAYLAKAGMRLDLFMPYGTDIFHYPFFNMFKPEKLFSYVTRFFKEREVVQTLPSKPGNSKGYIPFVMNQRKGIRASANTAFLAAEEHVYSRSLRKLGYPRKRLNFSVPMVYSGQFDESVLGEVFANSTHYKEFKKIRDGTDFLIFSNCRHCWKHEPDPRSFKGNDRLFIAFDKFIKTFPGRASIITFEYGSDYPESKKLVEELGLTSHVHWFPLMARKELMIGMSLADLVVGILCEESSALYGIVYESMALQRPLMHYRPDHQYQRMDLYPMINVLTVDEIEKALTRYATDKEGLSTMGRGAYQWFLKNCVDEPLNEITNLINKKVATLRK